MKNNFDVTETVSYNADEIRRANICEVLKHVSKALDERETTLESEEVLIQADVSRKKRKKVIDQLAAVRILQRYLDKQ